jgi:hypothetical protein
MTTHDELATHVDVAEWGWLRVHLERGGLIVVARGLELAEVGSKIAGDDTVAIRTLIDAGKIAKPSRQEISVWDRDKGRRFFMLIISPYVLIQEMDQTTEVTCP